MNTPQNSYVIGHCLDSKSPVWLLRIQSAHLESKRGRFEVQINIGYTITTSKLIFTYVLNIIKQFYTEHPEHTLCTKHGSYPLVTLPRMVQLRM